MALIGVLALQGDFEAHGKMLRAIGADVREVRGVAREGLAEPLRELAAAGTPVLGTCAGMIMLDRAHLGIADWTCERNAFGRQVRSFETDLEIDGIEGAPLRAMFIRAPWISDHGEGVDVLADVDGHPVAAREGNVLAVAFHPELTGEPRVHQLFLELVRDRAAATQT
jgi:5'-phosphate synthase pdxT subunit